jgi:acyl carrier protein
MALGLSDMSSKILTFIKNATKKDIYPSTRIEDLGLDSLDSMELILKLEEEFNVHINDDLAVTMRTVEDVITIIEELSS